MIFYTPLSPTSFQPDYAEHVHTPPKNAFAMYSTHFPSFRKIHVIVYCSYRLDTIQRSVMVQRLLSVLMSSRLLLHRRAVWVSRLPLPACREQFPHLETWERMRFRVEHDCVEREEGVGREEEVEVFQRLGLLYCQHRHQLRCRHSSDEHGSLGSHLTGQNDSILSRLCVGTWLTFVMLVKPAPSGATVWFMKAWNISHPQSRYRSSPVMRHM